jgi:hypothetical protein
MRRGDSPPPLLQQTVKVGLTKVLGEPVVLGWMLQRERQLAIARFFARTCRR